ncbi:hypothetical protein LguiA_004539 [Lonicera macranthoides]
MALCHCHPQYPSPSLNAIDIGFAKLVLGVGVLHKPLEHIPKSDRFFVLSFIAY